MDAAGDSGEVSKHVSKTRGESDSCYKVARNLAELCSSVFGEENLRAPRLPLVPVLRSIVSHLHINSLAIWCQCLGSMPNVVTERERLFPEVMS